MWCETVVKSHSQSACTITCSDLQHQTSRGSRRRLRFSSARSNTRRDRWGGSKKEGDHLLSWLDYCILPIAFMLHHASFDAITGHLWSQTEESQLGFSTTKHKEDNWEILYCHTILKVFTKHQIPLPWKDSQCSVSSKSKKWQVIFRKCAIIASHQESIMMHETNPFKAGGFFSRGKKRNNPRLSLQHCNIHLFSWGHEISSSPSTSIWPQITGEMMCQSGEGDWAAWHGHTAALNLRELETHDSSARSQVGLLRRLTERLHVEEGAR